MNNPTKILVLFVLVAALLLNGCAQIVKVDDADEEPQYTEIDDLSELGIVEEGADSGEALEDVTGEAVEEAPAEDQEFVPVAAPADAPVAQPVSDQIVVREGQTVELKPKGTDPDGDKVTYTFSAPLDGNGKWQTKAGDKGTYKVQVTASDGKTETAKEVEIVVKEENKAPTLMEIDDVDVKVGDNIALSPKATDPNNDKLTFTFSGWMSSSSKEATEDDVGTHKVTVTVSDGELKDSQEVTVRVDPKNSAPVMEKISDIAVKEGGTVSLDPKIIDPDGDKVTITYSGWMTSATYTTGYDDAGDYTVKITASDGKLETSQNVKITVQDVNRPVDLDIEFVIS